MELSHYIKKLSSSLEQSDYSVIVFQGQVYPHAFLVQQFDRIKAEQNINFKTIEVSTDDFALKSQLATSFLGMSCTYWLGDISSLKTKQKDDLLQYLAQYQGPHNVMLFLDAKTQLSASASLLIVTIKDKYFMQDAKELFMSTDLKEAQKIALFLAALYKIKNSFSLDELCMLRNYQDLISVDAKEFYSSWVTRLVVPDSSLFTLSQLFFEKKQEAFFELWLTMGSLYSEMFWVSFWSDQLYRAYFFIAFSQVDNFAAAKQVSFGLSFSFMKQTYKQYQLQELVAAHDVLYDIDTALKNGGHKYLIDQFYVEFLNGVFKR